MIHIYNSLIYLCKINISKTKNMSDSAKGPFAGYLFQIEKALLLLANLENSTDFISIENVDDIAAHSEDGTVIITVQAKHSISSSGTTFEDTSYALWRTIQIWSDKLELNIFNNNTQFVCSTNKVIPEDSLLYKIVNDPFQDVVNEIQKLLYSQKVKLAQFKNINKNRGNSINEILLLIETVLSKPSYLQIIKNNLVINDNEVIKERFFERIHLSSEYYSQTQKDSIYDVFFGWLTVSCLAYWKNSVEAKFQKSDFDKKYNQIISNSSISNSIFRTKKSLVTPDDTKIDKHRKEMFVKQIEDINRRKEIKDTIIKNAIIDFINSDIELAYIIKKGDYTEIDFNEFLGQCQAAWWTCFSERVLKENDEYNEEEKNSIAIAIYDKIMNNIEIKFKADFSFNTYNSYIRNGSFLKLSNSPTIGWRPDWETKYQKGNERK